MALRLLAQVGRITALVAAIAATVFLMLLLYAQNQTTLTWGQTLETARVALALTSFAAAAVLISLAAVGIIGSLFQMRREIVPGQKPMWLHLNMNNVVFAPQWLTPVGLEHRRKLIMSFSLAIVSFGLGVLGFALEALGERAT